MVIEKKKLKVYAKELSLDVFRVGCDKINFSILKMAIVKPIIIREISNKFNLSVMPANRRVNQLVKVGLLKREYKKTRIMATRLTTIFIKMIDNIQGVIEEEIDIKSEVIFK